MAEEYARYAELLMKINCVIKVCYLLKKYDLARDIFLKSKDLPAELFNTQHCLTRMFDVTKFVEKISNGRQLIFNRVAVNLNDRKK